MKIQYFFITVILLCLFTGLAFAEVYQYTDQNGVKHFTDNILEVPENQRKGLKIRQSIATQPDENEEAPPQISPEELIVKKDELDTIHAGLTQKREILNKDRERIGEKRYNERAAALNEEIEAYKAKSRAYEALVLEYNRQITSLKKKVAASPAPQSDQSENSDNL